MSNPICEYGCGQEAQYSPRKGIKKWCCSEKFNQCPGMIEKMNKKKKGRPWDEMYDKEKINELKKRNSEYMKLNNPMKNSEPWNKGKIGVYSEKSLQKMRHSERSTKGKTWEVIHGKEKSDELKNNLAKKTSERLSGSIPWNKGKQKCFSDKTISKMKKTHKEIWTEEKRKDYSIKFTMSLEDYKNKYPIFCLIEEMRYEPGKEHEKIIQVHCKNSNCGNSLEKGGWFTPTGLQLKERLRQVESIGGNGGSYLYCCEKCKQTCSIFNIKYDPLNTKNYSSVTSNDNSVYRHEVLTRADVLCEYCNSPATDVHHSRPKKLEPFFSLDPDFGVACCKECHYKYGHRDECSTGVLSHTICR